MPCIGSGFDFAIEVPSVPIARHRAETPCPHNEFSVRVDPLLHDFMGLYRSRMTLFADLIHIEIAVYLPSLKLHRVEEATSFLETAFLAFFDIERLAAMGANRFPFGGGAFKGAATFHANDFPTRAIAQVGE